MIELSERVISERARLADALANLVKADSRVRRCRRLEFADDGGTLVVVELIPGLGKIAAEVIARELEFELARALPRIPSVRVQPEFEGSSGR